MNRKHLAAVLGTVITLGSFGSAAQAANELDAASFSGMWKMDYIDKNKDGMVSKAEFMAMMEKAWDMKAKEMKVKDDKMKAEDYKKFREAFIN